jgi:hypothetical protein
MIAASICQSPLGVLAVLNVPSSQWPANLRTLAVAGDSGFEAGLHGV